MTSFIGSLIIAIIGVIDTIQNLCKNIKDNTQGYIKASDNDNFRKVIKKINIGLYLTIIAYFVCPFIFLKIIMKWRKYFSSTKQDPPKQNLPI